MAWTAPKTWSAEVLTSTDLNTYVRDNQTALKDPPFDSYKMNEGSDYTTTSTTFVDIDATNFSFTFTTNGGDILVTANLTVANSSGTAINYFDVEVDGARTAGDDGICAMQVAQATGRQSVTLAFWITGLSAASHTFVLQWKVSAGTATLYAGSGTTDVHGQFAVREVS